MTHVRFSRLFFAWSGSVVVPLTLELDESRRELGAVRMTSAQHYRDNDHAIHPNSPTAVRIFSP